MEGITAEQLKINGVPMPDPALEGIVIRREKIWSSNTGRTASGRMVGEIVACKTKIQIKWPILTPEQTALIESAVSGKESPFVPVEFRDMCGADQRLMVYFGTPTYTVYSWASGLRLIKDVTVEGIEQ